MTNVELKQQIDTDITDKTATGSVTPTNVGDNMKDVVDYVDQEVGALEIQTGIDIDNAKESANAYTDAAIAGALTGVYQVAGNWDASGGMFPTVGTGAGNAVEAGDVYIVSVAGTLGGVSYSQGDRFYALVDVPGQTAGNWDRFNFNPDEATEDTLGTVMYASPTDVASRTGSGVVRAEDLPESGVTDLGYLRYEAFLTQSGTSAPVATVMNNELSATITYQYSSVGAYIIQASSSVFTTNKTVLIISNPQGSYSNGRVIYDVLANNFITLNSYNATTATNGVINKCFVEIRVYP